VAARTEVHGVVAGSAKWKASPATVYASVPLSSIRTRDGRIDASKAREVISESLIAYAGLYGDGCPKTIMFGAPIPIRGMSESEVDIFIDAGLLDPSTQGDVPVVIEIKASLSTVMKAWGVAMAMGITLGAVIDGIVKLRIRGGN
jgi:hypothetical protein